MNMLTIEEFHASVPIERSQALGNEEAHFLLGKMQPSIWKNAKGTANAIGIIWNGVSDLAIQDTVIRAQDVSALLKRVSKVLAQKNDVNIELPTKTSVRSAISNITYRSYCIVDVEIDGVCIPFGFCPHAMSKRSPGWLDKTEAQFKELLTYILKNRKNFLRREIAMRHNYRSLIAKIGGDCRAAWLRMVPIDCNECDLYWSRRYEYAIIILDPKLELTLEGYRVDNPRQLLGLVPNYRAKQRRLADRRRDIGEARAFGLIDTVTEALIRLHGRDPYDVMNECIELGRKGAECKIDLAGTDEPTQCVWFREGVLQCFFAFAGGLYTSGNLRLFQEVPGAIISAAKGRLLHDIVEHPIFAACRPRITKVIKDRDGTDFYHRVNMGFVYPDILRLS